MGLGVLEYGNSKTEVQASQRQHSEAHTSHSVYQYTEHGEDDGIESLPPANGSEQVLGQLREDPRTSVRLLAKQVSSLTALTVGSTMTATLFKTIVL